MERLVKYFPFLGAILGAKLRSKNNFICCTKEYKKSKNLSYKEIPKCTFWSRYYSNTSLPEEYH